MASSRIVLESANAMWWFMCYLSMPIVNRDSDSTFLAACERQKELCIATVELCASQCPAPCRYQAQHRSLPRFSRD